VGTGGRFLG